MIEQVEPMGVLGFDTSEYLVTVLPVGEGVVDPLGRDDAELIALVGTEVRELDILNYALYWWQEGVVIVGLVLMVVCFVKLKKWRRYREIRRGEVYCKKCGYNLEAMKGEMCVECGAKGVEEGGKGRGVMGRRWLGIAKWWVVGLLAVASMSAVGWYEGNDLYRSGLKQWYEQDRWRCSRRYALEVEGWQCYSEWAWQLCNAVNPDGDKHISTWIWFSGRTKTQLWGVYQSNGQLDRKLIDQTRIKGRSDSYLLAKDSYWLHGAVMRDQGENKGFLMERMVVWFDDDGEIKSIHDPMGKLLQKSPVQYCWRVMGDRYLIVDSNCDFDVGYRLRSWSSLTYDRPMIVICDLEKGSVLGGMAYELNRPSPDGFDVMVFNRMAKWKGLYIDGQNDVMMAVLQKYLGADVSENGKVFVSYDKWRQVICGQTDRVRAGDNDAVWQYWQKRLLEIQNERTWQFDGVGVVTVDERFNWRDDVEGLRPLIAMKGEEGEVIKVGCDAALVKGGVGTRYLPELDVERGLLWVMSRDEPDVRDRGCDELLVFDVREYLTDAESQ